MTKQEMEKAIVHLLCQKTLEEGYKLSIRGCKSSTDLAYIENRLGAEDEEVVYLHDQSGVIGWVLLVYGNDGHDVIADYSDNTATNDIMAFVNELADSLLDKYMSGN